MIHHSLILVKYVFKGEENSVKFDLANNISLLLNIIELSKKIKFKDYDVYLRKEKIEAWQYSKTLKDIIKTDLSPIFFILKKGEVFDTNKMMETTHIPQEEEEIKKKPINLHENQVIVKNFPSRMDIFMILKKYLESINKTDKLKNEYIAETNKENNKITFTFNKAVN